MNNSDLALLGSFLLRETQSTNYSFFYNLTVYYFLYCLWGTYIILATVLSKIKTDIPSQKRP